MTGRQLATVAFKLGGAYALLFVVFGVERLLWVLGADGGGVAWLLEIAAAVELVCGVALLLSARRLAAWLFPDDEAPGGHEGAQAVGFALLGLWTVGVSLRNVTGVAVVAASEHVREVLSAEGGRSGSAPLGFVSSVLMLLVGLGLFLGARGLAGLWRRAQKAGRPWSLRVVGPGIRTSRALPIGISLLGLFLCVRTLHQLLGALSYPTYFLSSWTDSLPWLLDLGFGLLLFLKARRIATFWGRVRSA